LSIVFLATCAWAQRRGGGARGAVGGARIGSSFSRPQTIRSTATRTSPSFHNRPPAAFRMGERFRHRGSFGFPPYFSNGFGWNNFYSPYYNSFFPCADPYSTFSAYCPPFLTFGTTAYGASPYAGAGYEGDPRFVLVADGDRSDYEQTESGRQETVEVTPNPPRADALDEKTSFRRVDPRDAMVILNGQPLPASTSGSPLIIGSGNYTLRLTAKSDGAARDADSLPPTSQKQQSN
jgi:hypothetical protein